MLSLATQAIHALNFDLDALNLHSTNILLTRFMTQLCAQVHHFLQSSSYINDIVTYLCITWLDSKETYP